MVRRIPLDVKTRLKNTDSTDSWVIINYSNMQGRKSEDLVRRSVLNECDHGPLDERTTFKGTSQKYQNGRLITFI